MRLSSLLFIFMASLNLYAYKVGDTVSDEVAAQLQLGDEITVVDIYASWCVSCKHELPLINKLENVHIVGLDMDEDLQAGLDFQKTLGLEFYSYNDTDQKVVKAFNPIGVPALYYIKDKKVLNVRFGAIADIDKVILEDIESLQ